MAIQIAICDDDNLIIKQLQNGIIEYFYKKKIEYEIYTFNFGNDLLDTAKKINFSFVFLDIELDDNNGVDIAKSIRNIQRTPVNIVFVTNYIEYQTKVMSIHIFDYLLKPVTNIKLYEVMDDLMFWYNKGEITQKERIRFKTIDGLITLYIEEILYFEYNNRRIDIVTIDKTYHMYNKLKNIANEMKRFNFISPHAAYVINPNEIMQYIKSENTILMSNKKIIPISQLKSKKFKEEYINFINEKWVNKVK